MKKDVDAMMLINFTVCKVESVFKVTKNVMGELIVSMDQMRLQKIALMVIDKKDQQMAVWYLVENLGNNLMQKNSKITSTSNYFSVVGQIRKNVGLVNVFFRICFAMVTKIVKTEVMKYTVVYFIDVFIMIKQFETKVD